MGIAISHGTIGSGVSRRAWRARLGDAVHTAATRLFYAVLGAAGVLLWLVMQLPLGGRVRSALIVVMAGCFGMFALGWRLLGEQAAGLRRR
ncbi:hypothetical protein [Sinimarinibacterium thermocellulolyticum]|uniref:Uncharacterized protein n=1 Tax=Sinimarinibacterium thermocellulolyticum TaxID=3170016 RepID=A0ABV2A5L9_9GAMM